MPIQIWIRIPDPNLDPDPDPGIQIWILLLKAFYGDTDNKTVSSAYVIREAGLLLR